MFICQNDSSHFPLRARAQDRVLVGSTHESRRESLLEAGQSLGLSLKNLEYGDQLGELQYS